MSSFEKTVSALTFLAVGFTLLGMYLRVNKIWKRKHDREVAASQSLIALAMSMALNIIWCINFILRSDYGAFADTALMMIEACVLFIIGTGLFVREKKGLSLRILITQALRLERSEAGYLLKTMTGTAQAEAIIGLLQKISAIDNDIDAREHKLINHFAACWKIDLAPAGIVNDPRSLKDKFSDIRENLVVYLSQSPPDEQVSHVRDIMRRLIDADTHVTPEESLVFDELSGMMDRYMGGDSKQVRYNVVIIPQNPSHDAQILALRPDIKRVDFLGGYAYIINTFFSRQYAEMISQEYRDNHLLTTVHREEMS